MLKDASRAIKAIRKSSVQKEVTAAAVTFINLIPFAGGAIASIIGEIASRKNVNKICDVLSFLNERLESSGITPTQFINEDQIIELVHNTLRSVTTSSDRSKIEKLKRGLVYTFLESDSFERKQLFLETLRAATSIELAIVSWVYGPDPHVIREGESNNDLQDIFSGSSYVTNDLSATSSIHVQGIWVEAGVKDCPNQRSLLSHAIDTLKIDEGTVYGAIRLVDSRGLTILGPNLNKTGPCRIMVKSSYSSGSIISPLINGLVHAKPQQTPLELSRTSFGSDFLSFCKKY